MDRPSKKVCEIMKQLSNENRLLILCALLQKPMTVGELQKHVPSISAPALSQHLNKLKEANLITYEKDAQFSIYKICDPHLHNLIQLLKTEYCSGKSID